MLFIYEVRPYLLKRVHYSEQTTYLIRTESSARIQSTILCKEWRRHFSFIYVIFLEGKTKSEPEVISFF